MIFLVGPHASGKTELGKKLSESGFYYVDLGPIIRNYYKLVHGFSNIQEWVSNGKKILGEHFTDIILSNEVLKHVYKNSIDISKLVVLGNRELSGVTFLKNFFSEFKGYNISHQIFYIDAPDQLLVERYNNRNKTNITLEEFKNKYHHEDVSLAEIKSVADEIIINDKTIDDMYKTCLENFRRGKSVGIRF